MQQISAYTTVRIPRKYKRSLDLIRVELAKHGKVDEELLSYLKDDKCPFCGVELKEVEQLHLKYAKLKECPKCEFSKPVIESDVSIKTEDLLTAFSAGLLVGIGIFLLAKLLSKK